jgi:hypothetical protein
MKPQLADLIKPYFKPEAPYLNNEQVAVARQELTVDYPQVIRSLDESGKDDGYAVLSFLDSNESQWVKVRGIAKTHQECKDIASKIIKKTDSKIPLVYVKVGTWTLVTNYPKQIATEKYKLIDGKMILDSEKVNSELTEIEKCEQILEKEYEKMDQDATQVLKEKKDLLTKYTEDDEQSYILKKVMLSETRKQISFISEKLRLIKERENALIDLLSMDYQFEKNWENAYKEKLNSIGIVNVSKLDADFDVRNIDGPKEEYVKRLRLANDNFNNYKF